MTATFGVTRYWRTSPPIKDHLGKPRQVRSAGRSERGRINSALGNVQDAKPLLSSRRRNSRVRSCPTLLSFVQTNRAATNSAVSVTSSMLARRVP